MNRFLWIVLWVVSGLIIGPVHSWLSGGGFSHFLVAGILGPLILCSAYLLFKLAKVFPKDKIIYHGLSSFLLICFILPIILRFVSYSIMSIVGIALVITIAFKLGFDILREEYQKLEKAEENSTLHR